jgi:uroporphyrinogen-III decarboxylase
MAAAGKRKTPKRLFKDLFDMKDMEYPPFIPLVYTYASRVSKMPVEEMLADPAGLSRSLIMSQELFDYDGVISHYDPCLEMEHLSQCCDWVPKEVSGQVRLRPGPSLITGRALSDRPVGSMPVVRESASLMSATIGKEVPVIGVLNGPVSLVRRILDEHRPLSESKDALKGRLEDVQGPLVDFVKAYCNQGLDAIWMIEEDWGSVTERDMEWLQPVYATFFNVTRYFDMKAVVAFHNYDPANPDIYFSLGADALYFGGNKPEELPLKRLVDLVDRSGVCAGIGCPLPQGHQAVSSEQLVENVRDIGHGFFLSTSCEVDPETPPECLTAMVQMIKE